MKFLNLFLAFMFVVFAALQLNDPDPLFWTALYLLIAVVCGLAAFGRYYGWMMLLIAIGCIYKLVTIYPDFIQWVEEGMPSITGSMKASSPHVELVREFLGVVICAAALALQFFRSRHVRRT